MGGILRKLSWVIREFEIHSPLSPSDAIVALLRRVKPPGRIRLIPFRKPKHEFEGEVSPEGFRIMRVIGLAQNRIIVIGNVSPVANGTRVSISVRPATGLVALLSIVALAYLLVTLGWLVKSAPSGSSGWFFLFELIETLLVTFIVLVLLAAHLGAIGRKETRKVLPILEETFQARAVHTQTHQVIKEIGTRRSFGESVVEDARRFRVPLLWFAEAVGVVAVVLGIGFLIVFSRPPKTSVMGPGQVDWHFFSAGINLIIVGAVIALDVLDSLRFPSN